VPLALPAALMRPGRTLPLVLVAAMGAIAAVLPEASGGHAIIVSASPMVGAVLPQGAIEVRLEFNSRIDRERSRLIVRRPDGSESLVVLAADAPQNVLAGRIEAAMPGRWKLDWQVLSVDGHITRGEVAFSVREKVPAP
jgi:methionine-rich copper-binding protein CopC